MMLLKVFNTNGINELCKHIRVNIECYACMVKTLSI